MTGAAHKGLTDALARAWEREGRARGGPYWKVEVTRDDPWTDGPMGGRIVWIGHYGTVVGVVDRGTVVATAISASDRDGMNSVVRMLAPRLCVRVSLKGGVACAADDDPRAVARALRDRPHAVEDLAERVSSVMVCPYGSFRECVGDLLMWQGRPRFVDLSMRWGE